MHVGFLECKIDRTYLDLRQDAQWRCTSSKYSAYSIGDSFEGVGKQNRSVAAITSARWISPSHHPSICPDGCKGALAADDLLDAQQLLLDLFTLVGGSNRSVRVCLTAVKAALMGLQTPSRNGNGDMFT